MAERPATDSDEALLYQWVKGDRPAGEVLIARLLSGIYGLCLGILDRQADAEDVVQEAFARLLAQTRREKPVRDVRKWISTVAMNLCFDVRRRRGREISRVPEAEASYEVAPLKSADSEALGHAIGTLPERYRAALHLRYVLGLKPGEVAEAMGMDSGTAYVLLHRALSALRKKVGE